LVECLDLPAEAQVEPAGGETGQLWKVTTADDRFAVRVSSREAIDRQVAAMTAARTAGLPVPDVWGRASLGSSDALVLSWCRGVTLFEALRLDPEAAAHLGRLMGEAQRVLHTIEAPADVPTVADSWTDGFPRVPPPDGLAGAPQCLLHMDWHGLNLLVDRDGTTGEFTLCAVLDWDNARIGAPVLDVARTYTLLTVEPAFSALQPHEREILGILATAWQEGYGPEAASLPPECLAWAGRVMLADVAHRFADRPSALTDLRRWTDSWERRASG
jgi:aminoglycoside phosphotransferase (APT) family kinase protein